MDLPQTSAAPTEDMVTLTHVLYGLHGFSALMGMLGPMLVVTTFLTGWPSIIAVIINYVKRGDVRGTFVYSHYSWQLRTFWWTLFWVLVILVLVFGGASLVAVSILAFLTGYFPVPGFTAAFLVLALTHGSLVVLGLWVLYRIIRGWIALATGKPMPEVRS